MSDLKSAEVPPLERLDYVKVLNDAKAIVRASVLWKRFIDGTPLENDIAVWMADFAFQVAEGEARRRVPPTFDFLAHLQRQRDWSGETFGPGARTAGVIDHIRKELREIEADPADVSEWIDVVILGLDGAWRAGYQPQDIIDALAAKQAKNEERDWPDWRTQPPDRAIEHVKELAAPLVRSSAPPRPEKEEEKDDPSRGDKGIGSRPTGSTASTD